MGWVNARPKARGLETYSKHRILDEFQLPDFNDTNLDNLK